MPDIEIETPINPKEIEANLKGDYNLSAESSELSRAASGTTELSEYPEEDYIQENQDSTLSRPQRRIVILIACTVFLFSTILFFPKDKLLNYYLAKYIEDIPLSYSKIRLNVWTASQVHNIEYLPSPQMNIKADKATWHGSLWDLQRKDLNGELSFSRLFLNLNALELFFPEFRMNFEIKNVKTAPYLWNAYLESQTKSMKILDLELPALEALPIAPQDIKIRSFFMKLIINEKKLYFDRVQLKSDIFDIRLDGYASLREKLSQSQLRASVCLKPDSKLEQNNNALFGFYLLAGGSIEGELCIALRGSFENPVWNIISKEPVPSSSTDI